MLPDGLVDLRFLHTLDQHFAASVTEMSMTQSILSKKIFLSNARVAAWPYASHVSTAFVALDGHSATYDMISDNEREQS